MVSWRFGGLITPAGFTIHESYTIYYPYNTFYVSWKLCDRAIQCLTLSWSSTASRLQNTKAFSLLSEVPTASL